MEDKLKTKILDYLHEKYDKSIDEESLIVDFCDDSISRIEILFEIEQLIDKKLKEEDILSIEKVADLIEIATKN